MMTDLRELYQELILDHNKRPRNRRKLDEPDRQAEGYNPLSLGSYDIYVRWSPENPVTEIFRTLESVGLGVWTIEPADAISLRSGSVTPDPNGPPLQGGAKQDFFATIVYTLGTAQTGEVFLSLSQQDGTIIKSSERRPVQATPRKTLSTFLTVEQLPDEGPVFLTAFLRGPNDEELAQADPVEFNIGRDFTISHIEMTQVVQDGDNSVPLVGLKKTYVRVFAGVDEADRASAFKKNRIQPSQSPSLEIRPRLS